MKNKLHFVPACTFDGRDYSDSMSCPKLFLSIKFVSGIIGLHTGWSKYVYLTIGAPNLTCTLFLKCKVRKYWNIVTYLMPHWIFQRKIKLLMQTPCDIFELKEGIIINGFLTTNLHWLQFLHIRVPTYGTL